MPGVLTNKWLSRLTTEQRQEVLDELKNQLDHTKRTQLIERIRAAGYFVDIEKEDYSDLAFYCSYWGLFDEVKNKNKEVQRHAWKVGYNHLLPPVIGYVDNLKSVLRPDTFIPPDMNPVPFYDSPFRATITAEEEEEAKTNLNACFVGFEPLLIFIAPFIPEIFVLKKIYNSIRNISQGEKVAKSFWHLAGIGGGAYGGVLLAGFILSTGLPGIGNLAYLALTIISLAAVVGYKLAKYSAKGAYKLAVKKGAYGDEQIISDTNPDKYRVNVKEGSWAEKHNFPTAGILTALNSLKQEKNKIGCRGSLPEVTTSATKKTVLNNIIKHVRAGGGPITVVKRNFYVKWSALPEGKGRIEVNLSTSGPENR